MKIALLSIDASLSFNDRMSEIERLIKESAKNKARLVLLPELSYCGYVVDTFIFASHGFDDALSFFSYLAKKYTLHIGFGVAKQEDGRYKNSYSIVSGEGKLICRYDKIHIFSFGGEDRVFDSGNNLCVFEIDGLSIGISICYDLRFPEIFSLYSGSCDAIICPSAWPKKRISDFRLLLKARAVENRTVMIGINWQGGGGEYIKSSLLVDDKGLVRKPLVLGREIDIHNIEKKSLDKKIPNSVADKCFPLYAKLMAEHFE